MLKKFLKFCWENLIAGIAVLLPLFVTIAIIRFLAIKLNSVMLTPILANLSPYPLAEMQRLFLARTLIFMFVLCLIIIIGVMPRVLIVRKTFSFLERFLFKVPMINKIYGTTKEISYAFLGNKKTSFEEVVLIEYPRKGIYTVGFVTSKTTGHLKETIGADDLLNVYIPTTPNPTSGWFVLVSRQEVKTVDLSVEEAFKVVISAGVISPLSFLKKEEL